MGDAGQELRITRFSGLDEINAQNVAPARRVVDLLDRLVRGHEAAPLVVGNTMYVVTPFPEHPLRARSDAAGRADANGSTTRSRSAAAQGVACCDVVNRGAAYADGRIFFNTLDDHTIALDAATGQQMWNTKLGDINSGETMTMAPLVVKGKVLVGNSGGEFGVRGWLTALDAATGSDRLARLQHRPGQGRADRPELQAVLRERPRQGSRRHDLAAGAGGRSAAARCGAGSPTIPSSNLIYYGTANPGPWNPEQRPGRQQVDRRHLRARPGYRRGASGSISPARTISTTTTASTRLLADLPIGERVTRKVLMHPDRNGYIYVIDRATGEVLSATPFGYINSNRRRRPEDRPPDSGRREDAASRARSCATSARRRPARRTGSRRRSRRAPACSTSRTRTSAWTSRRSRRTTSPARRTSAPNVRLQGRARRQPRRVHGVGSGRRQGGVGDQGELSGLERRARDRRRRRLLRHDGRLVQGGGREDRRAAVAVQDAARESSASRSSTAARTASSTSRSSPALAAGPGAIVGDDLDPRDADRRQRLRRRAGGPENGHHTRRHALRLLAWGGR